jgi:hypothetical protein
MELSVKNVKVHEELSEETLCFSADLYDNGKLVAHVSNRGYGGSNEVTPSKGKKYEDVKQYDNLDVECEIFELVEEYNIVTKKQSKFLVLKKDGKYYTSKLIKSIVQLKKEPHYSISMNNLIRAKKKEGFEIK